MHCKQGMSLDQADRQCQHVSVDQIDRWCQQDTGVGQLDRLCQHLSVDQIDRQCQHMSVDQIDRQCWQDGSDEWLLTWRQPPCMRLTVITEAHLCARRLRLTRQLTHNKVSQKAQQEKSTYPKVKLQKPPDRRARSAKR